MFARVRPGTSVEHRTLPARYYCDAEIFRQETERIHAAMWLHAGRLEELPAPGSYVVREVAGASVIVVGTGGGGLAAFHNVCRHRGTRLCNEAAGTLPGHIQCPYHAWTYDLAGRLVAAPHMDQVQGFLREDHPLEPVAVDTWDGHVFINLAREPAPLRDQLANLPAKFRGWRMERLKLAERRIYRLAANWKLVFQNYSECLHCPIVHPLLNRQSHYLSGENEPPHPSYLGGRMELRPGIQSLTMDGTSGRAVLPGLGEEEARHVYYYALLPNLLLNLHPDYVLTFTLWPRAHDRTDIVCEWHFDPDEMQKPAFDPSDAVEFWDLTNRQDWELCERAQQGIASRGYRPGPYSNREEQLHALDEFVLARLGESASEDR
jgi:Rieske 2Fe-2S family protein